MSFAYKKLNPADIKSVPYIANKQYEFDSSSYLDNNIQTYIGEYIPITQDQRFDSINDNVTPDGNYRRLVYESIRHLYYQNYVTKSSQDQGLDTDDFLYPDNTNEFWHSSSYDNYEQNSMSSGSFPNFRSFPFFENIDYKYDNEGNSLYGSAIYFLENAAKIRVISIPQDVYGEGIKPYTFELSGSNFFIADDGQGNLFDYLSVKATYNAENFQDPIAIYAGPDNGLVIPVGNIFYNHGIAVITNQDYLCFIEDNPVARNNYINITNTQEEKILNILKGDFDDCLPIDTSSVNISSVEGFGFPDYTLSGSGDIVITPNYNSTIPGEYKVQYTTTNTLGLLSNTASVNLNITSEPLSSDILSLTQSCYQNPDNISSSITFSIDRGQPPYSWSIDNQTTYNNVDDLFQPEISLSLSPTRSQILHIKDSVGSIITSSLNTSFIPISGTIFQNEVSNCNTSDGSIIVSASGDGTISSSLSASFSNSLATPNEFSNLVEGSYTVYLKGANNCISSSTISVGKIQPVTASYTITHATCFGQNNSGSIILDDLDNNLTASDTFLTGGREPLTWSWSGPGTFSTNSIDIINLPTGSYILNLFDDDGCNYVFNYEITSSTEITYTASISYSSSLYTELILTNITGGLDGTFYSASINTENSLYTASIGSGSSSFILDADGLTSGSASVQLVDELGCSSSIQSLEIYGRVWEESGSFGEDSTGSVAQRNLNFYTYEPTGSEWVTVHISSGSETPVELATSGSATGSYVWDVNDTLYIDIYTGSNDNFYLRREFSGSLDPGIKAYYITVDDPGPGNRFYLNGGLTTSLELNRNVTYSFTQSDSSNTGHPFRFSTTQNGTHGGGTEYTGGISASGTPGTNGLLEFAIPSDAPDTLYYYCMSHSLMGGSSSVSMSNAVELVLRSDITSSTIVTGSGRMDHFDKNLDVSLSFGPDYNIESLHLTASKVNTEEENTAINFKFDKQVSLSKIRDNFTGSAENLSLTGSGGTNIADGSGSNFIARNNEFIDILYGNTGSFIGPNKLLFRDSYAFGNVINTISGSSIDYTSGSIWSGSVSASYFGGENAYYFTQRTDKVWLLTADIDHISFLNVYSYTSESFYQGDPIGQRTNLDPYTHKEYTIYAGSQRMENDLMYIMIIHEDENASMALPSGIGSGEVFDRTLSNLNDVNRVYYLFMSPTGSSDSQDDLDNRTIAVGKYFIDNVIYG
jgi:hypothetical protein